MRHRTPHPKENNENGGHHDEILDAQEAGLLPWPATLKPHYVRVIALEITGRRFKFGPEPRGGA